MNYYLCYSYYSYYTPLVLDDMVNMCMETERLGRLLVLLVLLELLITPITYNSYLRIARITRITRITYYSHYIYYQLLSLDDRVNMCMETERLGRCPGLPLNPHRINTRLVPPHVPLVVCVPFLKLVFFVGFFCVCFVLGGGEHSELSAPRR